MKAMLGSSLRGEADTSMGDKWEKRCKVPLGLWFVTVFAPSKHLQAASHNAYGS